MRKRILIKAAEAAGIDFRSRDAYKDILELSLLEQDPVQTTKAIFQFVKENEEVFEVLGGQI